MSEASDDILKRIFAQAPMVGADEGFVASLARDVAARHRARRARRNVLLALACAGAVGLAWLLAPLALTTSLSSVGSTLLSLPDQLGVTAQEASRLPGVLLIEILLVAVALPLAATAWLVRRV